VARSARPVAAAGFTVKSGWASAVLLAGPAGSPRVLDSRIVDLSDPEMPDARQPYHAGFGTARASGPRLNRLVATVERYGTRSVGARLREFQHAGYRVGGVGLVVGSLIDPERIANDHIRIHALEGQLFRGIIERAAAHARLKCSIWRERDLHQSAAAVLGRSDEEIRVTLTGLGREFKGAWRAEQKAAALAAWMLVSGKRRSERRRA
jgi:hypothetical protein